MARGAAFWEKVLAAIDGGEAQAEVAERFGVSASAIRYWITQRRRVGGGCLVRTTPAAPSEDPKFLPVQVRQSRAVRVVLEVDGVVVRLIDCGEPAYVAELVRALRSC